MTFGAYNYIIEHIRSFRAPAFSQYTTNKIMELNNENIEIQHNYFMDKMENQHKLLK